MTTITTIAKFPRALLGALAAICLLGGAPAMAVEERDLGPAIRAYLLEHPEVIREAMEVLQQREAAVEAEARKQALGAQRAALEADAAAPVMGNPKGDVTVVEFFDYRCGYCKRVAPAVAELVAKDAGVRVVMKELPILGPESLLAAKSALAAHKQGRHADFHKALMQSGKVDADAIDALAKRLGLDMKRFRADREDAAILAALESNHRLAAALGINGTPAFVVGDQLVPGAVDAATLAELVGVARRAQAK